MGFREMTTSIIRVSRSPYHNRRLVFEEEILQFNLQQTELKYGVDFLTTPVVPFAVEVDRVMVKTSEKDVRSEREKGSSGKPANLPPDYNIIKGLGGSRLPKIVERIVEIQDRIKELTGDLKTELKDLQVEGATLMLKAKAKSVMVGEVRTTQTGGTTRKILKKDLLLKNGVKLAVIEKSTVDSKPSEYSLKVTVKGEGQDGDEEE